VPTASPTAAPRHPPTFAPDGRTGDPAIDAIVTLVTSGAQAQLEAIGVAIPWRCGAVQESVPVPEWSATLARSSRTLYAVWTADYHDSPYAEQFIAVAVGAGDAQRVWRFGLEHGRVTSVVIGCDEKPAAAIPAPAREYDRYLVLPPRSDLPTRSATYGLSTPTGEPAINALLSAIASRDRGRVEALAEIEAYSCTGQTSPTLVQCADGAPIGTPTLGFPGTGCFNATTSSSARFPWVTSPDTALHSVIRLPAGSQPRAHYLVILNLQLNPSRWEFEGLFVRDGKIVGAASRCESAQRLYPARTYLIPPPRLGDSAVRGPTSGVPIVDRVIDAITRSDANALLALTDFSHIACVAESQGIGSPPLCQAGEPNGTTVDAIWGASCEGYTVRRAALGDTYRSLLNGIGPFAVFAATDQGVETDGGTYRFLRGRYDIVLTGTRTTLRLRLSGAGITTYIGGCGSDPYSEIARTAEPDFLLPPPEKR